MVAAEKREAVRKLVFCTVGETVVTPARDDAGIYEMGEVAVPGYFTQADDDANARERCDLSCEVDRAVTNLLRSGLVTGRGAADDRGDPGMTQTETVVAGDSAGFCGEAEIVKNWIHKVT